MRIIYGCQHAGAILAILLQMGKEPLRMQMPYAQESQAAPVSHGTARLGNYKANGYYLDVSRYALGSEVTE